MKIWQTPEPGKRMLLFCGDVIRVSMRTDEPVPGRAFIRTNIGQASVQRKEIIEAIETGRTKQGQDWHDIPMINEGNGQYSITLALVEVGHFEGKCFFVPENSGIGDPIWPEGDNFHVNCEPAEYCCANSIYCAFVRQFGPNKNFPTSKIPTDKDKEYFHHLDMQGFTIIPPSGTFRSFIKELDFIIDRLKCRIIHLLPINPTPTVYARMGRFGSPYAALDFTDVDPAYAEFDRKATPLQQFQELVDAIHRKDARIFIDLAINHTGWAAKIHTEHPEWLVREPDGSIHSPGAWGVTWGDLTELDHHKFELWQYLSKVFLTWCSRGVDGFRCDAGYMIPEPAWQYIIARVREQYPSTIFLLEGLGGDPMVTRRLLNFANMNWAYSELFQNYTRQEIENYIPYAQEVSFSDGLMVHYAETHDNNRLAALSNVYAQMRTALCALTSSNGAFGFANGVEWFAREKIDVHEASALNWNSPVNQVPLISRLNSILISHSAFYNNSSIRFIDSGNNNCVAFVRSDSKKTYYLLALANLDCAKEQNVTWKTTDVPFSCLKLLDLITEEYFIPYPAGKEKLSLMLAPGQVLCLSNSLDDLKRIHEAEDINLLKPNRIETQKAAAMALNLICSAKNSVAVIDINPQELASAFLCDPERFIYERIFDGSNSAPIVFWNWPQDIRRRVIIPYNSYIIVKSPYRFRARITNEDCKTIFLQADSLRLDEQDTHFAVFPPLPCPVSPQMRKIKVSVYSPESSAREEGELLLLPPDIAEISMLYSNRDILSGDNVFLDVNGRGGMLRAHLKWAELSSRYDALLAANLNPHFPEDRHIMWRRARIWITYYGRSVPLAAANTESFHIDENGSGVWKFQVPIGNGRNVILYITLSMMKDKNVSIMNIYREKAGQSKDILNDNIPVRIIIRPDIEDRNFHHRTVAMGTPEKEWPGAVKASTKQFLFSPSKDRILCISTLKGQYKNAPEWTYNVYQLREADRGLEPCTDLFSPGYFSIDIAGGECDQIIGQALTGTENQKVSVNICRIHSSKNSFSFEEILISAIRAFVVRRDDYKTVIAGYPWFLDWGRDTLICARGLIAADMLEEVQKILLLFAGFEENGTIPNMIHGRNASNRDTSDAPLWLFVACKDFCEKTKSFDFLHKDVSDGRTLLDVLLSIAEHYISGTPNGIIADINSGLIFSPSHFTWMDTNFPAATPREGYPIEIQALWHSALSFLATITNETKWRKLADKVKASITKFYPVKDNSFLSDCLHCSRGIPAENAIPDDAIRPNQLLCITLDAIDDKALSKNILKTTQQLLVPGAIRSLADAPVEYPLPVIGGDGKALNDPLKPYWGHYSGDEDTRRKPAYHNGTAWTWQFPLYPEAYLKVYGKEGIATARSILASSLYTIRCASPGHIPELLDGNTPHVYKGCDAQAWGATELYRVFKLLHSE